MSPRARKWGRIIIVGGIAVYWMSFAIFDIVLYRPSNSYELASNITIGFLGSFGAVSLWYQLRSGRRNLMDIRTASIPKPKTALPSPSRAASSDEAAIQSPEDKPSQRETIWFGIPRLRRISFLSFFTFACGTGLWAAYLGVIYALSLTGVQVLRAFNNYVESGGSAPFGTPNFFSFVILMGYTTAFVVAWYIWDKKHSVE